MIDDNAVYYTFSTISQTLGGAMALLGAFVLYKLQSIYAQIENEISGLLQLYRINGHLKEKYLSQFYRLYVTKNLSQIMRHINEEEVLKFVKPIYPHAETSEFEDRRVPLNALWRFRVTMLRQFNFALIFTAITIACSVVVLSLTPKICQIFRPGVLAIGLLCFVFCLTFHCLIVIKAVKS